MNSDQIFWKTGSDSRFEALEVKMKTTPNLLLYFKLRVYNANQEYDFLRCSNQ